jgi:hypothetical protein
MNSNRVNELNSHVSVFFYISFKNQTHNMPSTVLLKQTHDDKLLTPPPLRTHEIHDKLVTASLPLKPEETPKKKWWKKLAMAATLGCLAGATKVVELHVHYHWEILFMMKYAPTRTSAIPVLGGVLAPMASLMATCSGHLTMFLVRNPGISFGIKYLRYFSRSCVFACATTLLSSMF